MTEKSEIDLDTDSKKPQKEKEILVIQDQGRFKHDTGDVYDGWFEAKKKDRSVKMNGQGTYTTAEGDVYSGTWESDRLGGSEETTIKFTTGSRFEGLFKDWTYSGRGRYYYPDESVLSCDFSESIPVGQLKLTDPNGHDWLAKAEQGYGWFEPVNHFFYHLEKPRELGKTDKQHAKRKPDTKSSTLPLKK